MCCLVIGGLPSETLLYCMCVCVCRWLHVSMCSHCIIPLPAPPPTPTPSSLSQGDGSGKKSYRNTLSAVFLFYWRASSLFSVCLCVYIHLWEMLITKHKEKGKEAEDAVDDLDITQASFFRNHWQSRHRGRRQNGVWSQLFHKHAFLFACTETTESSYCIFRVGGV